MHEGSDVCEVEPSPAATKRYLEPPRRPALPFPARIVETLCRYFHTGPAMSPRVPLSRKPINSAQWGGSAKTWSGLYHVSG